MTPVTPSQLHEGAELKMIAESQDQYVTLPASVSPDGLIMSEWEPSQDELLNLMSGGRVRLWQYTLGQPMQPIAIEVIEPVEEMEES